MSSLRKTAERAWQKKYAATREGMFKYDLNEWVKSVSKDELLLKAAALLNRENDNTVMDIHAKSAIALINQRIEKEFTNEPVCA